MSRRASLIAHVVCVVVLNALIIVLNATLWCAVELVDPSTVAVITTVMFVVVALLTVLIIVHAMAIHLSPLPSEEILMEQPVVDSIDETHVTIRVESSDVQHERRYGQFFTGFFAGSLTTLLLDLVIRRR
jgi:hypothetical protein